MKRFLNLVLTSLLSFSLLVSPLVSAVSQVSPSSIPNQEVVSEAVQKSRLLSEMKEKMAQLQFRHILHLANVESAKENLEEVRETLLHLREVVADLDAAIKEKRRQMLNVKSQREARTLELQRMAKEVKQLESDLEGQKEVVSDLMLLLYVNRDTFYDGDDVNTVKLLASPDTVSETLQNLTYLDILESENAARMDEMVMVAKEIQTREKVILKKQDQLKNLDQTLVDELQALILERDAQQELLTEIEREEEILVQMLAASDSKDDDLLSDIEVFQNNIRSLEEKLEEISDELPEEQRQLIEQIEAETRKTFDAEEAAGILKLSWPVSPKKGLTAFFDDSGYQSRFGVPHGALDIRAEQGSAIYAAADGVVTDVVFDKESTAYAYILISHIKGVMSLYGHVSGVNVAIGDIVERGDIIGLSGGAVGGIGTGYRSTGPHLHFETFQSGARVDPLQFLPLEEVKKDTLPEKYQEQLKEQLEEKFKEVREALGIYEDSPEEGVEE